MRTGRKETHLKNHVHLAQCEGRADYLTDKPPVVATLAGEQAAVPVHVVL